MYDCNDDVLAFHNEKVTLSQPLRTAMRDRRNANRKRLKDRLKENDFPLPQEFIKQGSYAMLTMVQDDDNDYDIDDGVYFAEEDLKDKDGNPLSAEATRQFVRDALQDDRFQKQPKVLKNCVRIYYNEGYHVDMPIYRIRKSDGEYELASGDQWIVSRAADVEKWFYDTNDSKSPDTENGRQFRRIVRDTKKFARSRNAWKDQIASGFTITKLVEECYVADEHREDLALRETMRRMHGRLTISLEVWHPTTPNERLTAADDPGAGFLRDKLSDALEDLKILDDPACTSKQARKAWDKVFNTDFFSAREPKEAATESNVTVVSNLLTNHANPRSVDKQGGGRFA
jgi:hypothetical protein